MIHFVKYALKRRKRLLTCRRGINRVDNALETTMKCAGIKNKQFLLGSRCFPISDTLGRLPCRLWGIQRKRFYKDRHTRRDNDAGVERLGNASQGGEGRHLAALDAGKHRLLDAGALGDVALGQAAFFAQLGESEAEVGCFAGFCQLAGERRASRALFGHVLLEGLVLIQGRHYLFLLSRWPRGVHLRGGALPLRG